MKNVLKTVSGLLVVLVVIGTITFLAMRYMDVLTKPVEQLKRNLTDRFGKKCKDADDLDDIFEGEFEDLSPM